MLIVGAGIRKVVAGSKYHAAEENRKLLMSAGIELPVIEPKVMEYDKQ
jgi:deoxycytidylate deaminase